MEQQANTLQEVFGDVISCYSRAQAIDDGMLVDVTEQASSKTGFLGGFTLPVAITAAVHFDISRIGKNSIQDYRGRLHDVLWMASLAVRSAAKRNESATLFRVILQVGRSKNQVYKVAISGGDDGEPVITIMLRNED